MLVDLYGKPGTGFNKPRIYRVDGLRQIDKIESTRTAAFME